MSEPKPVKKSELAQHWGCSAPYVTKLAKPVEAGGKAMPPFFSLSDADNWRAVNAPPKSPRAARLPFGEKSTEAGKKNAGVSATTTSSTKTPGADASGADAADSESNVINVRDFIRRDVDFDELMIRQAEEKPMIASGLFDLACARGNSAEISAANKNWHECAKASAAVRKDFLSLQETTRALITLDEVMNIVGTELQAVRQAMQKLGERCATAANPAEPALALRVIDAAVDKIFLQLDSTLGRARTELAPALSPEQAPEAAAS